MLCKLWRDAVLRLNSRQIEWNGADMSKRNLLCFVTGNGESWEAICLDFDISVQATSRDGAKELLFDAISEYVKAAAEENAENMKSLLDRRAPEYVTAKYLIFFNLLALFRRHQAGPSEAGFIVPCPA